MEGKLLVGTQGAVDVPECVSVSCRRVVYLLFGQLMRLCRIMS